MASLTLMASTIRRATGRRLEGDLFLLLSVTQFHIPFYASRTLPNFVIFPVGECVRAGQQGCRAVKPLKNL